MSTANKSERRPGFFKKLSRAFRKKKGGRWRLRPGISLADFFRELNKKNARYCVLRWFDGLPAVAPGEDVDLLIADDDLPALEGLLTREHHPETTPFDVYSTSGLPGAAFRGLPYYPPALAVRILENARMHVSGARVPAPLDHFYSLAYHVVYHKGPASRLEEGGGDHDYQSVLTELGREVGIVFEPTLRGLDRCLAESGWRPPLDTLVKLAKQNSFCGVLVEESLARAPRLPGLAVFVVRDLGVEVGATACIREEIERVGFEVLAEVALNGDERERARDEIRGGNWSKGPFGQSAGGPAVLLAAFDAFPSEVDEAMAKEHPGSDNLLVHLAKRKVRRRFNDGKSSDQQANIIHASDSATHAWHYLDLVNPAVAESVAAKVRERLAWLARQETSGVERTLTRFGNRAKVELVRRADGTRVVRKIFRPQHLRFLKFETEALTELARHDTKNVIPPLLASGEGWLEIPFYEEVPFGRRGWDLLPLAYVRQVFEAARAFQSADFVLFDFNPHNLLLTRDAGVKLIDFEHVRKVDGSGRVEFAQSMTIAGPTPGLAEEVNVRLLEDRWYRATGLYPRQILLGGVFMSHVFRVVRRVRFAVKHAGKWLGSKLRRRKRR